MPKNKPLEYQAQEPAFLQRLRAGQNGNDGRHERPLPRPKKTKTNDEDDAPTYVVDDGSGETMSKADYEKLVAADSNTTDGTKKARGNDNGKEPTDGRGDSHESAMMSGALPVASKDGKGPSKTTSAGIGLKKRKVAAVVGQDGDQSDEDATKEKPAKTTQEKKKKKKGKGIKLSFDED